MRRTIKNGRFCIYNGNEFKVNRDSDGNIIILTKNDKIKSFIEYDIKQYLRSDKYKDILKISKNKENEAR